MYLFFKNITLFFLILALIIFCWFILKWQFNSNFNVDSVQSGEIVQYTSREEVDIDFSENKILNIISYNMGFAAGPMQYTLADEHPESFFRRNIENILNVIKSNSADVVLLQEVDIDSKRSWHMNQLEYLMERLGWGYAAPVIDWELNVPFRKEGKIVKATVVLSRYPIVSNEFSLTESKPNFENKLLNIFYYPLLWKSAIQRVGIKLGEKVVDVYNVHLCVWSRDARKAQLNFLKDWIGTASAGNDYFIGGDFNFQAYIRGTPEPLADLSKAPVLNSLWQGLPGLGELLIDSRSSTERIHRDYTFPERKHRYDFIFYSGGVKLREGRIVQGIDASDHLPVFGSFAVME